MPMTKLWKKQKFYLCLNLRVHQHVPALKGNTTYILTYLHCILPYISTHSTNYLLITFGKPHFHCFQSLPSGLIGAIGTVLMKHVCYCGGQISPINESTMADCFKYTWDGWKKFSTMTKPRAFAASAWVI